MGNFQNSVFGPLSKEACFYFYFFTVLFFILLVILVVTAIVIGIRNPKKINFSYCLHIVALFCNLFLAYFVNRLLYTMCNKTLT